MFFGYESVEAWHNIKILEAKLTNNKCWAFPSQALGKNFSDWLLQIPYNSGTLSLFSKFSCPCAATYDEKIIITQSQIHCLLFGLFQQTVGKQHLPRGQRSKLTWRTSYGHKVKRFRFVLLCKFFSSSLFYYIRVFNANSATLIINIIEN